MIKKNIPQMHRSQQEGWMGVALHWRQDRPPSYHKTWAHSQREIPLFHGPKKQNTALERSVMQFNDLSHWLCH